MAAYHPPSWVDFSPPEAGNFQLSKKLKQTKATAHLLGAQEFLWGPQVEQPKLGGLALPATDSWNKFVFLEPVRKNSCGWGYPGHQ